MGKISKRFVDGLVDLGNGLEYKDLPKTSHNGVTIFDPDIDMANNPSYVSTNIGSGVLVRKDYDRIKVSWSWAVSDYDFNTGTGTDNSTAIQACFDVAYEEGVPLIIDGKYGVGSSVYIRPITLLGHGVGVSVIGAVGDGFTVLSGVPDKTRGSFFGSKFSVFGYAKQNPTIGTDADRGIKCSGFDSFIIADVEVGYTRQMGVTSYAAISEARHCRVHHVHRDGINFTDSVDRQVIYCDFKYIYDDAVALHIPPIHALNTPVKHRSIAKHNTMFNCRGIKILSGSAEVKGNTGDMMVGYGVFIGSDPTYGEGFTDKVGVEVIGNRFKNVINSILTGHTANIGAGVFIQSREVSLADGTSLGGVNIALDGFNDELPYLNYFGKDEPHVGSRGVIVGGNSTTQTWTGGANISDFGYGDLWTASGFQNIPLTGTLHKDGNIVTNIRLEGSITDMSVDCGYSYGVSNALLLSNVSKIENTQLGLGVVRRCNKAVSGSLLAGLAELTCINSSVNGGTVDLDPMHESTDRVIDGTWINLGGSDGAILDLHNFHNLSCNNLNISNAKKLYHGNSVFNAAGIVYTRGLGGAGVGIPQESVYNSNIIIDANPSSASYKSVIQGSLSQASSIPISGTYCVGQEVYSSNPSVVDADFGVRVVKYVRLTDGDTHIANVDWAVVAI